MPLLTRNLPGPRLVGRRIMDASLPLDFGGGLEYSPPARGTWTIMHLGLLIPETHIIFVCARCCLRGVSMSAAELRALDRFSTITIEDRNLLEGNTEAALVDGVTDILSHLPKRPKGVIIYTSCVHEFVGSDLTFSFEELRKRFPDIAFTDGYMTPILRKRITPDMRNRRQIYTLLQRADTHDNGVTIVGDVRPIGADSDIRAIVESAGRPWRSITATRTWDDYQALARSGVVLSLNPSAVAGREWMAEHLGQTPLVGFTTPWTWDENRTMLESLQKRLGGTLDLSAHEAAAREALQNAKRVLGDTPIAIDFTATTRPCSLTRLLLEEGFNVKRLYIDGVLPEEKADFLALQKLCPELELLPTVTYGMVRARPRQDQGAEAGMLAIGQKAAWYERTHHFVNMVEGDGADGFSSIGKLARALVDAAQNEKSARDVIQIKALGCTAGGCL